MNVIVDLMNESGIAAVPAVSDFQHWGDAVLEHLQQADDEHEVGIRLVSAAESAELNQNFRHKQGPTNVLSFAYSDMPIQNEYKFLGDLAICTQLVESEARQQQKTVQAHWAHLTVHGLLHLLGYDHQQDAEAEEMEALEGVILGNLGYANPYNIQHD